MPAAPDPRTPDHFAATTLQHTARRTPLAHALTSLTGRSPWPGMIARQAAAAQPAGPQPLRVTVCQRHSGRQRAAGAPARPAFLQKGAESTFVVHRSDTTARQWGFVGINCCAYCCDNLAAPVAAAGAPPPAAGASRPRRQVRIAASAAAAAGGSAAAGSPPPRVFATKVASLALIFLGATVNYTILQARGVPQYSTRCTHGNRHAAAARPADAAGRTHRHQLRRRGAALHLRFWRAAGVACLFCVL